MEQKGHSWGPFCQYLLVGTVGYTEACDLCQLETTLEKQKRESRLIPKSYKHRDMALLCFILESLLQASRQTLFIKQGHDQVYLFFKNCFGIAYYSLGGLQMEFSIDSGKTIKEMFSPKQLLVLWLPKSPAGHSQPQVGQSSFLLPLSSQFRGD